jgi:hypothetical protein
MRSWNQKGSRSGGGISHRYAPTVRVPNLASFRHLASIRNLASFRHNCLLPSVCCCRPTLLPEEIHLPDNMGLIAQSGANSPAPGPLGLRKLLKYRTQRSGI